MKQLIFIILIITGVSCKSTYNILITDYIEVTMKDNSRDTIKSVYFDNTVIDEYVKEWLLKQNNIDPKKVLSTKTIRTDRRKVYK